LAETERPRAGGPDRQSGNQGRVIENMGIISFLKARFINPFAEPFGKEKLL
jgi:hypothetical protein